MTKSAWDCCDPCALLIDAVETMTLAGLEPSKAFEAQYLQTLDAFGWLTDRGQPDTDRVKRNLHASQSAQKEK